MPVRGNVSRLALAVAVLVVAGLAGVAETGASAAPAAAPWAQTNSNGAQSRANLTESTLTRANVSNVQYLRSVVAPPLGSGCTDPSPSAPVLSGGRLYTVVNGTLIATNAGTGAVVWRVTPDPDFLDLFDSIAVSGGLVIVSEEDCESQSDPDGAIQAFKATNGTTVWTHQAGFPVEQMVVSGADVVETGASEGGGQQTAVLKVATGAVVWHKSDFALCANSDNVVVVGGKVVWNRCNANNGNSLLEADALATGTKSWTRTGSWAIERGDSDATSGHHLYAVNGSGPVSDLNPSTGATRFTLAGSGAVLAVDATNAYATCTVQSVCAYTKSTGAKAWTSSTPHSGGLAAEANGVLYLSDGSAVSTASGATITSLWFTDSPTALVIGDGRIAVVNDPRVLDLYGLAGS
jgi:outer membrane protein assembly factor BamB